MGEEVEDMMAKRILVPLSDGAESPAVSLVRAIAQDQGSTVRLLRVMPVPEYVVDFHGRTVSYADQEMASLSARGLSELALAEHQLDGVPVETVVRFGETVEEILLEADAFHADLIAMTTTERSRFKSTIAPGVGERVLRAADVPVLLLRD
jgi:nucleotide-binding universal stress UspA family protein